MPSSNPYGSEHQRERANGLEAAWNTPCPRCGELMLKGQKLQWGHVEDVAINPSAKAERFEHASCGSSAGAELRWDLADLRPSRVW